MKLKPLKYLLPIIILFYANVFSQVNISGQIKNQNNKPVELLEVQLQSKDSLIVKSELTNSKGEFKITTLKGNFLIIARNLGKTISKKAIRVNQDTYIGYSNY
jgi:hypothetical protein